VGNARAVDGEIYPCFCPPLTPCSINLRPPSCSSHSRATALIPSARLADMLLVLLFGLWRAMLKLFTLDLTPGGER
jgi:hypothetical protein